MSSAARNTILGIDLGTTFSLVAVAEANGARLLRDQAGEARLPSVIAVTPDQAGTPRVTVGWEARRHAVENPETTVYSVKRLIGKGLADLERELPFLAYAVVPGPRDTVQIEINNRRFSPEEISSVILRELKDRAAAQLGHEVRKAVVTVPAYFDDAQRQATRDAGRAAGLEVLRIINEPTAAALAYGIGLRDSTATSPSTGIALPTPQCPSDGAEAKSADSSASQLVGIYDLGGGTFDVSILQIDQGVFQVISTAGDTRLGGDDLDRAIITLVQDEVREQFGLEINSPQIKQALRTFAESVKIKLSDAEQAEIELELGGGRVYRRTLTRDEFEARIEPLVARTVHLLRQAARDAGVALADLGQVILVGGSTRTPLVRRMVADALGKPPYTAVNPDEVVALGAAMQAAVLAGHTRDMLLLDVTPLSLGIETLGGAVGKLIMKNTTIPCRATEMFTTFVDGQTAIKITVLQGERELARDCRKLGEFELRGIPPMPAGIPKIEVEFLIDANGILNVSATEQRSGERASIQIIPNHGLTRDEVARIERDSIAHAREDIDAHRGIDLRNQVTFDITKTQQMLDRVGGQLAADERAAIENAITELQALAESTEDLNALHEALTHFGHRTLRLAELGIRDALVDKPKDE